MSCPCAIIRGHRLQQEHILLSEVEVSIAGRMQTEILIGIFLALADSFHFAVVINNISSSNLANYVHFYITAL